MNIRAQRKLWLKIALGIAILALIAFAILVAVRINQATYREVTTVPLDQSILDHVILAGLDPLAKQRSYERQKTSAPEGLYAHCQFMRDDQSVVFRDISCKITQYPNATIIMAIPTNTSSFELVIEGNRGADLRTYTAVGTETEDHWLVRIGEAYMGWTTGNTQMKDTDPRTSAQWTTSDEGCPVIITPAEQIDEISTRIGRLLEVEAYASKEADAAYDNGHKRLNFSEVENREKNRLCRIAKDMRHLGYEVGVFSSEFRDTYSVSFVRAYNRRIVTRSFREQNCDLKRYLGSVVGAAIKCQD